MTPALEHQGQDTVSSRAGCEGRALSLWRGLMPTTMATIAASVADIHGLTVADLKDQTRIAPIAKARHHAMWLMYRLPNVSTTMIGRFLGGRDHTSVIHGIRRHQERLDAQTVMEAA